MAKIYKIKSGSKSIDRLRCTAYGRRIDYYVNLEKYSENQWLKAHNNVMLSLTGEQRVQISNKQLKELVEKWHDSTKEMRNKAKTLGLGLEIEQKKEETIEEVMYNYIKFFCGLVNSKTASEKIQRQCKMIQEFLNEFKITKYSELSRQICEKYPEWRLQKRKDNKSGNMSPDPINKEINRLKSIIKYGVKYHEWVEKYLLDDIKVKSTPENTKIIRPFELAEIKEIFRWLKSYDNWYLHDTILLALCTGMEAKALDKMQESWWYIELGILRIFDKRVSGVIDAKTQFRARDIPITKTMLEIYKRGYIFNRPKPKSRNAPSTTEFRAYAERALRNCELDTGIKEINMHRFRHSCATARLSAGWQLIRVSRMLGHSNINTTAKHYAEYDLSASPQGFEGMIAVYKEFCNWLDEEYF